MRILVREIVGENAVTLEDGQEIFDQIRPELGRNGPVELDFSGVAVVSCPFLNAAIGQLLKDLRPEELEGQLKVENLTSVWEDLLHRVIEHAKKYYSSSSDYQAVQARVLQELFESD